MATGPIETHLHRSFNWGNAAPGPQEGPRGRSASRGNGLFAQCVRLRSEINHALARASVVTKGANKRRLAARCPYISPSMIQAELSCASLPSASGDEVSRTLHAGSSTGAAPKFVTHAQPLSRR